MRKGRGSVSGQASRARKEVVTRVRTTSRDCEGSGQRAREEAVTMKCICTCNAPAKVSSILIVEATRGKNGESDQSSYSKPKRRIKQDVGQPFF